MQHAVNSRRTHNVSAPVAFDFDQDINISFNIRGKPQHNTDVGSYIDGVRVVGSDLPFSITTPASGLYSVLNNTYLSTGGQFLPISPKALSNRLNLFEEMYQYYAIRELRITYIPAVGTSTAGSFATCICNNESVVSGDFNTIAEVLQFPVRFLAPYWSPRTMVYKFNGTQVWTAHTDSGTDTEQTIQCVIGGCSNAAGTGSPSAAGYLYIQYVVDFYGSMSIDTTDAIKLKGRTVGDFLKQASAVRDECKEVKDGPGLSINVSEGGLEPPPMTRSTAQSSSASQPSSTSALGTSVNGLHMKEPPASWFQTRK
jgi:hypothetical protein